MSVIRILPEDVSNRIAAGEVVERPASIVKELLENSLDAGARRISVQVERGGRSLVRVIDDGSGMDSEDALMCLEAHATSKIRDTADIEAINTLGFRGEALPSIASVTRFSLVTRRHDADEGTEVEVDGGRIRDVRTSGGAPGTTITARNLFFNMPARRKFLRGIETEEAHIQETVLLQALAHPAVGIELTFDRRPVLAVQPGNDLRTRATMLLGREVMGHMLEVEYEAEEMRVYGFVARPGLTRGTRREQRTFVNGRPVDSMTLYAAIRDAYNTMVMKGRYAVALLFIELPPDRVDINVHPAKREVRFREDRAVGRVVGAAVRQALRALLGQTGPAGQADWSARDEASQGGDRRVATTPTVTPEALDLPLSPDELHSRPPGRSWPAAAGAPTGERPRESWNPGGFRSPPLMLSPGPAAARSRARQDFDHADHDDENAATGRSPFIPDDREDRGHRDDAERIAAAADAADAAAVARQSGRPAPHHDADDTDDTDADDANHDRDDDEPRVDGTGETVALGLGSTGESSTSVSVANRDAIRRLRVIGHIKDEFLLAEGPDGLVLIDQHAAHERVLFEQIWRQREARDGRSQGLLIPVTIDLTATEAALLRRHLQTLLGLGFGVEEFGGNSFIVTAVPPHFPPDNVPGQIRELLDDLRETASTTRRLDEHQIATAACKAAVKAHDALRPAEVQELLDSLLRADLPYTCPHGRPTMIQISFAELEKRFGRRH